MRWLRPGTRSWRSIRNRRGPRGAARPSARPRCTSGRRSSGSRCARRRRCGTRRSRSNFASLNADLAVVAAYGLILPKPILDAPRLGCINVHASLLPRWRGAAPIQRAILAGDETSGITLMQMDEGLDTGTDALMRHTLEIDAKECGQINGADGRILAQGCSSSGSNNPHVPPVPQPISGRHLRQQDRQGRDADRLEQAGDRNRTAGPRLCSPPRRVVRSEGRADQVARGRGRTGQPAKPGESSRRELKIACGTGRNPPAAGATRRPGDR